TFEVEGELNLEAFQSSLNQLVQRHEIFRTNFYSRLLSCPVQVVFCNKNVSIEYTNLENLLFNEQDNFIHSYVMKDKEQSFQLDSDSLMRMHVIQKSQKDFYIIWSFHHILLDGWSLPLLFEELFTLYYGILKNDAAVSLPQRPSYKNYIKWVQEQENELGFDYWGAYLEGYEGTTLLPIFNGRINSMEYKSKELSWYLGENLAQKLRELASQNNVTLNVVLQVIWGVLLQKYNNTEDVVFGSVVSGRPTSIANIERMIGLFINTIPVRIKSSENENFINLIRKNQKNAIKANSFEISPLYEIQARTDQKANLVSHIMIFENYPLGDSLQYIEDKSPDKLLIKNPIIREQTNYDFNIIVIPGKNIEIQLRYNARVYDELVIKNMKNHFNHLLQQIIKKPEISVADLQLISYEENRVIAKYLKENQADYPRSKTIHALFEEQVVRTPN
ncbi:condensation domain-containing protein, partial [Paenibacillus polymyxa]|uniref:condensation domain-containing protein n=1 Tax=Paenibacillus polymyxa TaxID=1406 RepID=UPI002AB4B1B0